MIPLMQSNQGFFASNGGAIQCMRRLGNALVQAGLAAGLEQRNSRSATERFGGEMPEGLEDLPGEVDASMNSYSSDAVVMGQELLWLARVLPDAARGNYAPYNNSGTDTRQVMLRMEPIFQTLCQMDQTICQISLSVFSQMMPALEEQVYLLARRFGN